MIIVAERIIHIPIKRMSNSRGLPFPSYRSRNAAALDLLAAIRNSKRLKPGERLLIPCGFAIALPRGFEAQIRPESDLAARHGVTVLNSPGTVDSDFRGEIEVLLINLTRRSVTIKRGMRIVQMVIKEVVSHATPKEVQELSDSIRSERGFGHTGG